MDIEFEKLVAIIKKLPSKRLLQLKAEMERIISKEKDNATLKSLLLKGPVATQKQLETIEGNRKSINQWRAS
ncbi:hypothetical protein [Aequorivita ciconiae]|nr:hypothetical protein [Aequorivita sp. H23M31]